MASAYKLLVHTSGCCIQVVVAYKRLLHISGCYIQLAVAHRWWLPTSGCCIQMVVYNGCIQMVVAYHGCCIQVVLHISGCCIHVVDANKLLFLHISGTFQKDSSSRNDAVTIFL